MSSNGFAFSLPNLPSTNSVERLSFDEFYDMGVDSELLPSFPPKTLKQIMDLVQAGKTNTIHIFEWLDAIENQQQWDDLDDREKQMACIAVWTGIGSHSILGDIALFKMGLSLDDKPSSVVSVLVDSIEIARNVPNWNELDVLKLDWLLALKSKQYQVMAEICYNANKSVASYIKSLRLPQASTYQAHVEKSIVEMIPSTDLSAHDDAWLISNFYALKTTQQRIDFCESLIIQLGKFHYGKQCNELIELQCLPMQDQSYWNRLSAAAKQILKLKFQLSSYFDLKAISSALYSEKAAEVLAFTEDQTRQIRSRSMFWSNYSSCFERVRVLLPKASFHFVEEQNNGVPPFVDNIDENDQFETEVYIFEIGKTIAVEFLRGALSETRFFKNDAWYAQRLFDSKTLTIAEIRSMNQLEVHDHLSSWQYFCEKLLRTKFNINPNSNIPYFKGLPPDINQYKDGVGLITAPDELMLNHRRQKLESWVEKFWSSEVDTGKFGELRGLEKKSSLYLSKALMAKQLGNADDYDMFIKKAANQGNSEAMWQLGKTMLLNARSDAKTRLYGQDWVSKAAAKGHREAMETADRFRIAY